MTRPLRETFDEVAELYDRARPGYPPALVAELAVLGPRVLEVGPGTGKLTVPLARAGCEVTAVELGPALAEVARRNLREFPGVRVEVGDFDTWPLPAEPYDLMVCATSYHWLDPALRVDRAADALRPGGTLAIVTTRHVAGGTDAYFTEMQGCYERWFPAATGPGWRLPDERDAATDTGEFEKSPRFERIAVSRHAQEISYSSERYLDVLRTYSNHRALPAEALANLLRCLGALMERSYDGRITLRYLHELITVRRT